MCVRVPTFFSIVPGPSRVGSAREELSLSHTRISVVKFGPRRCVVLMAALLSGALHWVRGEGCKGVRKSEREQNLLEETLHQDVGGGMTLRAEVVKECEWSNECGIAGKGSFRVGARAE